jgi:hypothetical protein
LTVPLEIFYSSGSYFGLMAMATGELMPPPEKGEFATVAPVLVNALTVELPEFVTQTLLEASIEMLFGAFKPLPEYTVLVAPVGSSFAMVVPAVELVPLFAIQAFPLWSMAIAEGTFRVPPAANPFAPEGIVPSALNFDTVLLPPLVTQTAPAESVAIAVGALNPPPV